MSQKITKTITAIALLFVIGSMWIGSLKDQQSVQAQSSLQTQIEAKQTEIDEAKKEKENAEKKIDIAELEKALLKIKAESETDPKATR